MGSIGPTCLTRQAARRLSLASSSTLVTPSSSRTSNRFFHNPSGSGPSRASQPSSFVLRSGPRPVGSTPSYGNRPQQPQRVGPSTPKHNPIRTAIRQAEDDSTDPKYVTNHDIPYRTVQVASTSGPLSSPRHLNDILSSTDLNKFVIRLVSEDPPVVRLFDKELLASKEKEYQAAQTARKRFQSDTRIVTISWACADGDLNHKIQQARRHLLDGDRVELVFAVKGAAHKDKTPQSRKDEIVKSFMDGIQDIGIRGRDDLVKGKGLSSFWNPKNEIRNAAITELKDTLTEQQKGKEERAERRRLKAEERRIKAEEERIKAEKRFKQVMDGVAV
ncbi:hypothetical protein BCR39DRAFT_520792 [Naematelia encephala]|uniref:Translation initiation factor 3 N-terminal domain-containing protein n=1 Tax=Naematelia encephala TaxID=71784 RepID=A0A1Y2BDX3_9TREE|nr:hypothetical protein BCR39DRAFT_520792 [Naematelia encephala]